MNFSDSTDHLFASGSVRTTLRSSASFLSILGLGVGAALLFGTSAADAAYYYNYGYYGGYYSGYRAAPTYRQTRPVAKKAKKPQEEQAKKEAPKPIKGPLSVIVSIGEQRVRVFDGTSQIAESPISSGQRGYPTPMGVFTVIQKDRYHHSNLYAGAPMPYMQRITWSGTAMHTGVLPGYAASHGCIRLPNSFASRLWTMTKLGTRVIVARHGLQPAPIAHAKLDTLKKSPVETAPIVEGTGGKTAANGASEGTVTDGFSTPMPGLPSDQFKPSTEILKDAKPVPAAIPVVAPGSEPATTAVPAKPALKPGPVAIFISRKEGKLFVRNGFDTVFDKCGQAGARPCRCEHIGDGGARPGRTAGRSARAPGRDALAGRGADHLGQRFGTADRKRHRIHRPATLTCVYDE